MKKKPAAKKAPAKPPKKKVAKGEPKKFGGAVTKVVTTATDGARKTIPAGASVLLSDAQFGAAVIGRLKEVFGADRLIDEFETLLGATTLNSLGIEHTDYRTRLAALEKIVYLTVGKPLDRVQSIETTTYSNEELEEMIAHSQALRAALREMLRPYDAEDGV